MQGLYFYLKSSKGRKFISTFTYKLKMPQTTVFFPNVSIALLFTHKIFNLIIVRSIIFTGILKIKRPFLLADV